MSAECGNVLAQELLGECFSLQRYGFPLDSLMGIEWYEKALQQTPDGEYYKGVRLYYIGSTYVNGPDINKHKYKKIGIEYLRKSAKIYNFYMAKDMLTRLGKSW